MNETARRPNLAHPKFEDQSLVRIQASDGFWVDALLVTQPREHQENFHDVPLLLQIHGSLGHFLARGTPRLLPHKLLERGYSSLSINTRLASSGQITGHGIFPDTSRDIDAALEFLSHQGFSNVFVLGYSLGASMAVYWAANHDGSSVRGLILEGCLYSTPASQRRRFAKWGATPTYEEIYAKAKEVLGEQPYESPRDEVFVAYQSKGPDRSPIHDEIFTYKTWWFMYGPEAHAAMAHRHIGKVRVPLLIMRGESDIWVEPWEPEALGRIARATGNPHARVLHVGNAGHDCMENAPVALDAISDMMSAFKVKA